MKCKNCGHVCSYGYEYPEYYCELGIAGNPTYEKYDTGEGCSLTKQQRINLCKKLKLHDVPLWWDESES